jgi:hypothetical protein
LAVEEEEGSTAVQIRPIFPGSPSGRFYDHPGFESFLLCGFGVRDFRLYFGRFLQFLQHEKQPTAWDVETGYRALL